MKPQPVSFSKSAIDMEDSRGHIASERRGSRAGRRGPGASHEAQVDCVCLRSASCPALHLSRKGGAVYGKVFSGLWNGSMRGKPNEQLVFVYMLANCGPDGVIDVVPEVIADATGLALPSVTEAIRMLMEPDPRSRTEGSDGRRIVLVDSHRDWGWLIVNYEKYRQMSDPQSVREQTRIRVRNYRERAKRSVTVGNAPLRQAEAEAEAEAEESKTRPLRASRSAEIEGFEEFYREYPRREDRIAAARAYASARKKAPGEEILRGVRAYADAVSGKERQYIKLPATWLNAGGWMNTYDTEPEDKSNAMLKRLREREENELA